MSKHPIGGMRSKIVRNNRADMRYRKKAFLREKDRIDDFDRKFRKNVEKESIKHGK